MAERSTPNAQPKSQQPGRPGGEQAEPSYWEWALGAVGLLLVLASLGYFTWYALTTQADAPAPVAEVLGIERQAQGFLVRVRVRNDGAEAAASLKVAGVLKRGEEVVEESETEFQYLPGGSWRDGGMFFRRNPAGYALELGPKGYELP